MFDFQPGEDGCDDKCPIRKKEREICCIAGRICCYACPNECFIKEEYDILV
jgi:hypothetical protein